MKLRNFAKRNFYGSIGYGTLVILTLLLVTALDAQAANVGVNQPNRDSAAGASDQGVEVLAVRKDTGAALATADGNYSPLQTDSTGNLRVTGTLTANIGTSGSLALDTTLTKLTIAQGAALGTNTQVMGGGSVTTAAPAYTTGQISPLSLTTGGLLRVDGSGVTQPVSGTVTAAQATAANLNAQVVGSVASAGTNAGNPVKIAGVFNTTQPTVTTGQIVDVQSTARGAQIVATGVDTFNVTVNAALPTGANTIGALSANQTVNVAQISGVAPSMDNGISGTGVQRVTIASNATIPTFADRSVIAGSITTTAGSNVALTAPGTGSAGVQITGTWTGTLTFQATVDGTNWFTINGVSPSTGALAASTAANGQWVLPSAGYAQLRVLGPTATGTATVSIEASNGTQTLSLANPLPAGTNVLGALSANQSMNLAQVGGTTLTGANVVDGTNTAFRVNCVTGCAGSSFADNAAFTFGTTTIANMGAVVDDVTTNAVTENSSGAPRMSTSRILYTDLRNAAGTEIASATAAPAGTELGLIVRNIPSGTQTVSGTVTANIGTAGTLALDATLAKLTIAQGATLGTNTQVMGGGSVTTAAPAYTTGQISPLSLTTGGLLRVDGSGVTQPVSQATAANLNAQVVGAVASAGANAGNPVKIAGVFNSTQPTVTTGQIVDRQATARGAAIVATGVEPVTIANGGVASTANSSTTFLAANATFTGTSESSLGYEAVSVNVCAIGTAAPPGTLKVQQSSDGTNWDIEDAFAIDGGTACPAGAFDVAVSFSASNFRVVYVNGATAQTAFRLQSVKWPVKAPLPQTVTRKGVQSQTFLAVQRSVDTGRTYLNCSAVRIAGITTEGLASLTCNKGGTNQAAATTYTVTSGKTLRITTLSYFIINTTTATIINGSARLRAAASCLTTSPILGIAEAGTPSSTATLQLSGQNVVELPEGIEVAGGQQICVSHLAVSANSAVTMQVIGYEY